MVAHIPASVIKKLHFYTYAHCSLTCDSFLAVCFGACELYPEILKNIKTKNIHKHVLFRFSLDARFGAKKANSPVPHAQRG